MVLRPVFERDLEAERVDYAEKVRTLPERDERRPVELSAYVLRPNKKIVDVKVVDLSYDGCAVRTFEALVPGEKVKLSVLGRGAVNAVVRWYRSRKAGLRFEADVTAKTHWPRKAERMQVDGEVSLRRSGGIGYRVPTMDVTRFGCKCEFVDRPAIYERLWVKLDGLESIEAIVCWVEQSRLGLMFKAPLHPAVFDMLLVRMSRTAVQVDDIAG